MPSREQIIAALDGDDHRRSVLDSEVKRKRATARTRAHADARQALVVLHRDEYSVLYAEALVRRAAELEVEL